MRFLEAKTTTVARRDGGKKSRGKTTKLGKGAKKSGAKSKTEREHKKGRTGSDSSQLGIDNFFPIKERLGWTSGPRGIVPETT